MQSLKCNATPKQPEHPSSITTIAPLFKHPSITLIQPTNQTKNIYKAISSQLPQKYRASNKLIKFQNNNRAIYSLIIPKYRAPRNRSSITKTTHHPPTRNIPTISDC